MLKSIPDEKIENRIFQIRGKRVMLDSDLAELYGVTTKVLNQAVKRNKKRFPEDFMFRLTWGEIRSLRSHFVTLKGIPLKSQSVTSRLGKNLRSQSVTSRWGGHRYLPYAFTEQGVSMLSSVLNSNRAIVVNIQIMRAFVNLRRTALTYTGLKRKFEALERKYDAQFHSVFKAIQRLLEPPQKKPRRRIGFR
ncbi:MAG: ORF6N domain-containing protein [Candidatus Omnitrophica bacterium]|nr:ORF6N domain-containing protein [Candidatus Omnitrophota bacterium]